MSHRMVSDTPIERVYSTLYIAGHFADGTRLLDMMATICGCAWQLSRGLSLATAETWSTTDYLVACAVLCCVYISYCTVEYMAIRTLICKPMLEI